MVERSMTPGQFRETALSQELEKKESDRARQEALYLKAGVTTEKAAAIMPMLSEELEKERQRIVKQGDSIYNRSWTHEDYFLQHGEYAFYLNSSDPINPLYENVIVKNKKVLTVGGSGDFAEIFAARGAAQVDVIDFSYPACFWNELKLIAAKHLDYKTYLAMFGTLEQIKGRDIKRAKQVAPIFDSNIYDIIKENLSPQAQAFFDSIQKKQFKDFFMFNAADLRSQHFNGMVRYREGLKIPFKDMQIKEETELLKNAANYRILNKAMQSVRWSVNHADLTDQKNDFSEYDFVYMSNVGYGSANIIKMAFNILNRGVGKVGFTVSLDRHPFEQPEEFQKIKEKIKEDFELGLSRKTSRVLQIPIKLSVYGSENLEDSSVLMGDYKKIGEMNAKISGLDIDRLYGCYIEVAKDDVTTL